MTTIEKQYYTISEVSEICDVKPHVLRYWEKEFSQLRPSTRRGKRRYYEPKDIQRVKQIRQLLYDEGFTISGARAQLSQKSHATKPQQPLTVNTTWLKETVNDLQELLDSL